MLSPPGEPPPHRPDRPRRAEAPPGREPEASSESGEYDDDLQPTSPYAEDSAGSDDDRDPNVPLRRSFSRFPGAESEDEYVPRELDRLRDELAPRRPKSPDEDSEETPPEPKRSREESNAVAGGEPSPYLEERLNVARTSMAELVFQAHGVGQELEGLRTALALVDREIDRASSELGYIESNPWDEGVGDVASWRVPATHPLTAAHPVLAPRPPAHAEEEPASRSPNPPVLGTYEDFTVERYNRTVSKLHDRRLALRWGTVAAAVGISSVLLWLTLQAHEPVPPIWLAVLPLVWMVPVPFFVAAFRGTQRVLRENRLELSEEM